jgi:hypothetical protein
VITVICTRSTPEASPTPGFANTMACVQAVEERLAAVEERAAQGRGQRWGWWRRLFSR